MRKEGVKACFHSCKLLDCTVVLVELARARATALSQGWWEERGKQTVRVVWEDRKARSLM